jgi:hypothetical protein
MKLVILIIKVGRLAGPVAARKAVSPSLPPAQISTFTPAAYASETISLEFETLTPLVLKVPSELGLPKMDDLGERFKING